MLENAANLYRNTRDYARHHALNIAAMGGLAFGGLTMANPNTAIASEPQSPDHPTLFDAQSSGVGQSLAVRLGVHNDQVGVVFGVKISKDGQEAVEPGKCEIALAEPGFHGTVKMETGRYEVYDLPKNPDGTIHGDPNLWAKSLIDQRAYQQTVDEGCSPKSLESGTVVVWTSNWPSPPYAAPPPR
ncbi:MAG TPA: hypothetical protein VLF68_02170 [Candidatus Saccharimonadales bacterium]|nr:hypothetical protein [Candidatus Saccharimonadales bacterium]